MCDAVSSMLFFNNEVVVVVVVVQESSYSPFIFDKSNFAYSYTKLWGVVVAQYFLVGVSVICFVFWFLDGDWMGTGMTVIWSSYPAQRKYADGRHRGCSSFSMCCHACPMQECNI
jgi:hypothetical protein